MIKRYANSYSNGKLLFISYDLKQLYTKSYKNDVHLSQNANVKCKYRKMLIVKNINFDYNPFLHESYTNFERDKY